MQLLTKILFPPKVVCILSSSRKDKYDAIKKYLCTDCPIPSQCVLARTLSKPQTIMTVATKIALQMNCKMGGELWSVEIPVSIFLSMVTALDEALFQKQGLHARSVLCVIALQLKQVMIVGIDCYHDTVSGKQSIAGFVASLNQSVTR